MKSLAKNDTHLHSMVTGRKLAKEWEVSVAHALYHHKGTWYHHLREFPGALFDPNGYLLFGNKADYEIHPMLRHGAHLHVADGISLAEGYTRVK
ncbi:hypothetical protein [Luteolibacter sp. Populi]|uniref:hypothetical protein n=1 Tax=Luteolibacter sp. Populi TaxID=3230487 RepID=UPI0034655BDB